MKHFKYLLYIVRHKWFVFQECRKRGIVWRGLIHDWSKLLPDEWIPYANYFYGKYPTNEEWKNAFKYGILLGKTKENIEEDFYKAWNKHQKRNKHHWQYWIVKLDNGSESILRIPQKYVKEMISDWIGAGRAINGKNDVKEWYIKNYENIRLHPETRKEVDKEIFK